MSDEIVVEDLGFPDEQRYHDFSGIPGSSGAVYAGNLCNGGDAIQFRAEKPSGIVTTKPGGKRVKSVSVEWMQGLTGTRIDVYGRNSAYKSAGDLYDPNMKVLGSINKGSTTTLDVEGDYKYVGLRSYEASLKINKIIIVWETDRAGQVAKPVLSPADGTHFADSLTVTATCATAGAGLYYTTNGDAPTSSCAGFPAGGLTIKESTTLKVIASDGTLRDSEVAEATYTKGKAQPELAFEQDSYTVNTGGTVTVKAVSKPAATVTYSLTDSGGGAVESVDPETGEVKAGMVAGTATVTATVEENDGHAGAKAACTVNVVDQGNLSEEVALVAEKNGAHYAMMKTLHDGKKIDAAEVSVLNGKVVAERKDLYGWIVDQGAGTIRDPVEGKHVAPGSGNPDLSLKTGSPAKWDYSDGMWQCDGKDGRRRYIGLYFSPELKYFGLYLTEEHKYAAAGTMPVADGYRRDVASGHYGTVCLPHAVSAGDMAGAEFFSIAGKVTDKSTGKATSIVLEAVRALEAGTPYIFRATDSVLAVIYSGGEAGEAGTSNGLVGSFAGCSVDKDMFVITKDNKVRRCGERCSIGANRAYIDMEQVPEVEAAGAEERTISIGDGSTGISATPSDGGLSDVWTPGGVKVRHQTDAAGATLGLPRGVYVVNGRKVIVK